MLYLYTHINMDILIRNLYKKPNGFTNKKKRLCFISS